MLSAHKRRWPSFIFSLLLVLGVVTPTLFVHDSVAAQGQTTITYGIWDSRQEPGLRQIADDFEKANPDIKVDIQVTGWEGYWTMLEAAATGGSLPDVFWMHSNEIYKYGANDQLLPLDDLIKESNLDLSKFPKGLVDIYKVNGHQYGIPKDFDTIALWYNKKLFDEAGVAYPTDKWTWDDLKEAAKKLTNKDKGIYGIATMLANQEGFYNFMYTNGGTALTSDNKSGYTDPKTVEALEYYFSFGREGLSPTTGDAMDYFANDKAAIALFGSWRIGSIISNESLKDKVDVVPLPSKDGKRVSIYNGLANAISAKTEHKEAAWKFVNYLSSKEVQEKASKLGVAISAYEGASDVWVDTNKQFNLKSYIEEIKDAQIRPYTHETTKWEEKVYEILKPAYLGEKPVKEAAEEAAKAMNELIEEEE